MRSAHKGYGLSLINESVGGFIGGALRTIRNRWDEVGAFDKGACVYFFHVIHPDAICSSAFAKGRNQSQNVKAVIEDVLGHGNEKSMLPGQLEAAAARSAQNAGLLFSAAEFAAFNEVATACSVPLRELSDLKVAD
ncbi:MAG: hypothetical protein RL324_1116 [Verrucomicrobiota bacterium]|jgi:L-2-hydroxycarboxylate dehydrogenase (NAD+)